MPIPKYVGPYLHWFVQNSFDRKQTVIDYWIDALNEDTTTRRGADAPCSCGGRPVGPVRLPPPSLLERTSVGDRKGTDLADFCSKNETGVEYLEMERNDEETV